MSVLLGNPTLSTSYTHCVFLERQFSILQLPCHAIHWRESSVCCRKQQCSTQLGVIAADAVSRCGGSAVGLAPSRCWNVSGGVCLLFRRWTSNVTTPLWQYLFWDPQDSIILPPHTAPPPLRTQYPRRNEGCLGAAAGAATLHTPQMRLALIGAFYLQVVYFLSVIVESLPANYNYADKRHLEWMMF